jgi:hypothetical protein
MRLTALIAVVLFLASGQTSQAAIYPWSILDSAQIEGAITDPVPVSVVLLSSTAGVASSVNAFDLHAYSVFSEDSLGNLFAEGIYGITIAADPAKPLGGGNYLTTVSLNSSSVLISNDARFLVTFPETSHTFGFVVARRTCLPSWRSRRWAKSRVARRSS